MKSLQSRTEKHLKSSINSTQKEHRSSCRSDSGSAKTTRRTKSTATVIIINVDAILRDAKEQVDLVINPPTDTQIQLTPLEQFTSDLTDYANACFQNKNFNGFIQNAIDIGQKSGVGEADIVREVAKFAEKAGASLAYVDNADYERRELLEHGVESVGDVLSAGSHKYLQDKLNNGLERSEKLFLYEPQSKVLSPLEHAIERAQNPYAQH